MSLAMASRDSEPPSSSQSTHRLPTVSASQALRSLRTNGPGAISTGLRQLDALLQPRSSTPAQGGLSRGQLTEIYGPPGSGKTAFGLQATASALRQGGHVVWIDAATPVPRHRLEALLSACPKPPSEGPGCSIDEKTSVADMLLRFHYLYTRTLAHLLALTALPTTEFPPDGTLLIVIDSVSTLFDCAYSWVGDNEEIKNDGSKWAAGRRYGAMDSLASTLSRIAAVRDIPIMLTSQMVTRVRESLGAVLVPAMAGSEWENAVATRLVVFRDWPPEPGELTNGDETQTMLVRYVGLVKVRGLTLGDAEATGAVIPFIIRSSGLCDVDLKSSPVPSLGRMYDEVPEAEYDLGSEDTYGSDVHYEVASEGLLINEAPLAAEKSGGSTELPPPKRMKIEGADRSKVLSHSSDRDASIVIDDRS